MRFSPSFGVNGITWENGETEAWFQWHLVTPQLKSQYMTLLQNTYCPYIYIILCIYISSLLNTPFQITVLDPSIYLGCFITLNYTHIGSDHQFGSSIQAGAWRAQLKPAPKPASLVANDHLFHEQCMMTWIYPPGHPDAIVTTRMTLHFDVILGRETPKPWLVTATGWGGRSKW